jgi:sulfopyruvate decarboxylase subunit beta
MQRIDIIRRVAEQDGLIVANIGFPARELFSVQDRPGNFYMLGSMGMASSIGLGLALNQPRPVYVIDGDGALLMNLGSLATIAREAPPNLCLVIVDNRVYGSTGNQPTARAEGTDIAALARAAGCPYVLEVKDEQELQNALTRISSAMTVIVAHTEPGNAEVPIIDLTPVEIKQRFMQHVEAMQQVLGNAGL